jgi:hypothetical protein
VPIQQGFLYIIGLKDKNFLSQYFGEKIGKAKVSGYCNKFKKMKDIHLEILEEAIRYGLAAQTDNAQ